MVYRLRGQDYGQVMKPIQVLMTSRPYGPRYYRTPYPPPPIHAPPPPMHYPYYPQQPIHYVRERQS